MDRSKQQSAPHAGIGDKPSRSVSNMLTVLRHIAEHGANGNIADLNSHRLKAEEKRNEYRSTKSTIMDGGILAAVSCGCATAAVMGMLQMLAVYFE